MTLSPDDAGAEKGIPKGIPNLEKKVFLASLLFAGGLLILLGYAAFKLGVSVPTCVTNVKPFTAGQLIPVGPGRYEAHVVARMWEFEPDVIRVPRGSIVDFYVISQDVAHGFYIPRTNVNLMALPGVVNYAQARFGEPGTYPIICHEYCGVGHQGMAASVVVAP
ncbi:MAG: cytochrome c oxidase subunit II [Elusimicrobiota bacterium]